MNSIQENDLVLEEKNELIETLTEKLTVMEEELKVISESHEKLSNKVSRYEEMGGIFLLELNDDDQPDRKIKGSQSSMYRELIKISQKLIAKDRMLKKIEALPDLPEEIKKILNSLDLGKAEDEKEKDIDYDEFKNALLNLQSDLHEFKGKTTSLFFNESEVSQLVKHQCDQRDKQRDDQKQKLELAMKVESLTNELRSAVEEDNPNIQAITKKLADEQINKAEMRWAEEKMQILRDLENRVSKVVDLEIALDESEERFRRLENNINQGDVTLRKKIGKLENQAEQLTIMYHQVVSEKSVLKVDYQVAEKKLKRKDEKIAEL